MEIVEVYHRQGYLRGGFRVGSIKIPLIPAEAGTHHPHYLQVINLEMGPRVRGDERVKKYEMNGFL